MQRLSTAPLLDHSIAYLVGAISVIGFAGAVFAIRANDLDMRLNLEDEVKVEAAQFPFSPHHEIDIFAAGCNGKAAKTPCPAR